MHNCIENGVDVTEREVNYAYTSVNLLGVTNVIDSLYAIRLNVFEEKKVTLRVLRDAVKNNWAGQEELRQLMLNAPKFGNDLDDVDEPRLSVPRDY